MFTKVENEAVKRRKYFPGTDSTSIATVAAVDYSEDYEDDGLYAVQCLQHLSFRC